MRYIPLPQRLVRRAWYALRHGARVHTPHISLDSVVGRKSIVRDGAVITRCTVGPYSYVNSYAQAYHADIGPFCSIGPAAQIGPNEHIMENVTTCESLYPASELARVHDRNRDRTRLEADVWVGSGAVILKGRSLGVGSVVAAGAVVREDVPRYAVVAGVPARVIRYRFPDEVVERLVASRWWELPPERLEVVLAEVASACGTLDPVAFLDRLPGA